MQTQLLPMALLAVALLPASALSDGAHHEITGPADAYVYELAEPGTYTLPVIREAADAAIVDESGQAADLRSLIHGKYAFLAFIYTRCGDVCPIASARMSDLQALAAQTYGDTDDLMLVSFSFDPAYDTPGRMARYAESFRLSPAPPWYFVTAPSVDALAPVIAAYDQPVNAAKGAGAAEGSLSHLLRVFLIDREGRIRNIYSADFLDPRLLMNDLETLRMEEAGGHARHKS